MKMYRTARHQPAKRQAACSKNVTELDKQKRRAIIIFMSGTGNREPIQQNSARKFVQIGGPSARKRTYLRASGKKFELNKIQNWYGCQTQRRRVVGLTSDTVAQDWNKEKIFCFVRRKGNKEMKNLFSWTEERKIISCAQHGGRDCSRLQPEPPRSHCLCKRYKRGEIGLQFDDAWLAR